MEFDSKSYYEVAQERHKQAMWIFEVDEKDCAALEGKRYSLVIYLAGLAVESLFRGFRLLSDNTFDSRHNLSDLYLISGIEDRFKSCLEKTTDPAQVESQIENLRTAVDGTAEIWSNSDRFRSDRVLIRRLRERGIIKDKFNKGDKASVLRKQTENLLKYTQVILSAGKQAWKT